MNREVEIKSFNVRVYGLFINDRKEILLADELRFGMRMTKFPGGGLQFGEGTVDCLKREAEEEFGQEIEIIRHFYTTDFFQLSLFHSDQQLISIYYLARFKGRERFRIAELPYEFNEITDETISFRYFPVEHLTEEELTLPVDRHVAVMLRNDPED